MTKYDILDNVVLDLLSVTDGGTRLVGDDDRLSLGPFFASGGHLRLDLLQLALVDDVHDGDAVLRDNLAVSRQDLAALGKLDLLGVGALEGERSTLHRVALPVNVDLGAFHLKQESKAHKYF